MWPPWRKSGRRKTLLNCPSFAFQTFKDVQHLCKDEEIHRKVYHRTEISASAAKTLQTCNSLPPATTVDPPPGDQDRGPPIVLRGAEKRIVVYFTSLRVVRKTFEDCCSVRLILKGFRVSIDERDLSMDSGFLMELEGILGKRLSLPRVFIGGRYFGGAEEIRQLHETGELKKYIEGFPAAEKGVCESCGGYRFILCNICNGSHKCYTDKSGFRSCSRCNENGLIRCPACVLPV